MDIIFKKHNSLFTFLLLHVPLTCLCQSSNSSSTITATSSPPSNDSLKIPGCGTGLDPMFRYLCDRQAAWGIVLEVLASSGFLFSLALLIGLLVWSIWFCLSSRNQRSSIGGIVASMSMFLLATAGLFATTFSFIIRLTPQTCPTRVFLFSVLFSLAFSCLLARCLTLLGFAAARGWGEPGVALGLFIVQVIISTQWLLIVLVRDKKSCEITQNELVMLQIYVMCLLAIGLVFSMRFLCRSCFNYSYSYKKAARYRGRIQSILLSITLLLSTCIWMVWITMILWGNHNVGRQPQWDDPVLTITLVANGWVLLMGHGLSQVASLCKGEAKSKDMPLNFSGWTSPSADIPGLNSPREGRDNESFVVDGENKRDRRGVSSLRSPYESGFSMTEIDVGKDFSIPRPKTTNYREPYE
ncbi:hypothetical protein fugu_015743 [Takifugu bimaculatus]|uniref:G-protein coupled receptors family 3 profile domain-containing protein n=1 Tax=Takifugu bimaculatus TaxID=433685 RepID=A0A4Z2C0A2_9TELE|nr:hypothetical protein fugu_015743 [Takifugu bimaculatus]